MGHTEACGLKPRRASANHNRIGDRGSPFCLQYIVDFVFRKMIYVWPDLGHRNTADRMYEVPLSVACMGDPV